MIFTCKGKIEWLNLDYIVKGLVGKFRFLRILITFPLINPQLTSC